MKKLNKKGFVLAETLIVTVFLMVLFTMIYENFYPLIGEYEKREYYDDVDSIYSAYWIKKIIESGAYKVNGGEGINSGKAQDMKSYGFMRFECSDVSKVDQQRELCINLVRSMEIDGCDKKGDNCSIFITKYRIGGVNKAFKDIVAKDRPLKRKEEYNKEGSNYENACKKLNTYLEYCKCEKNYSSQDDDTKVQIQRECEDSGNKRVFSSSFKDYVQTLPDYSAPSLNFAEYRVFIVIRHRKDGNNYYSFATMEVNK